MAFDVEFPDKHIDNTASAVLIWAVFKKVIGQDLNESNRPASPSASELPLRHSAQEQPAVAPAPALAPTRPGSAATRNILSTDVEIKGTVRFTNDLVVDGKIEGEIASEGNLTVGENARIKAEVRTATVVVYGKVHGNIEASDRVELKASAEVVGDIKSKVLSIEAGAIFVGKSTVGTPANAPAPTSGANKPSAPAAAPAQQSPKPQPAPAVAAK